MGATKLEVGQVLPLHKRATGVGGLEDLPMLKGDKF